MKSKLNDNRGFVHIIITLIVILVIISLLGLNATEIWNTIFKPLFSFLGNLIVSVANFLTELVRYAWEKISF